MIRELTKSYLRDHDPIIICVCTGDSIHDVECLLIDTYHCYYWNGGDYHQDTQWHVGDTFKHNQYIMVSYKKSKDILVLDFAAFWDSDNEKKANTISSRMLFREKKIKRLRKKCSKREI